MRDKSVLVPSIVRQSDALDLLDHEVLDARLGRWQLRVHPLQLVDEELRDCERLDPVPVGANDVPRSPLGRGLP